MLGTVIDNFNCEAEQLFVFLFFNYIFYVPSPLLSFNSKPNGIYNSFLFYILQKLISDEETNTCYCNYCICVCKL